MRKENELIEQMISIRKQKKITQTELAEKVNTKQQVISRIESGKQIPSLKLFCKIVDALGCELKLVKIKQE